MNDAWTALLEHGLVRFATGTALTAMASAVWLVVIAFRTNVIWGMGVWFGYPYGAFAFCVHHRPGVTFVRRLVRDLSERRKPPLTLVRRGVALMREEPALVRRQQDLGAEPARAKHLEPRLSALARR